MRELKFRAWDIDCRRFEYFEIGENDDCYGMFRVAANKFGSVVEQYTGCKDQYNKEVYEGDIIQIAEDIGGYVIQDGNGQWVIFGDTNKKPIEGSITLGELKNIPKLDLGSTLAKEYCTVIGNIHENPELLGGKA